MKLKALLVGVALSAISTVTMTSSSQAYVGIYIDSGDYWRHHRFDYCYYHDCGDRWYDRHHRHRFSDRDWWRDEHRDDHRGDWDHHDGDHRDH